MSYGEHEASRESGSPISLYLFRYGEPDTAVFAFTDAEETVENAPIDRPGLTADYIAIPIDRDEIEASGTLDNATIEIRTSDDSPLADLFRLYPPSQVVTLTIREGHAEDPTEQFLVKWSGRITAFGSEGNEAQYTAEPISTSAKRVGLRRRWQYGCPHWLYGPQCKANKAAATETQIVLNAFGATITLPEDWTPDARKLKFQGGLAEWTLPDGRTELRTILRTYPDGSIVLTGYATGLEAGSTISLSLGCNHQAGIAAQPNGDCGPLHNNIQNFGGQPWIPLKSPTGLQNIYY